MIHRVENLYSENELIRVSNEHLLQLLEDKGRIAIDNSFSNYRIALYSVSVLSAILSYVYKVLPKSFDFLLFLSVVIYFASQFVVFVLENIVYGKATFVVKYKNDKFNIYTGIDVLEGVYMYAVYPYYDTFDSDEVAKVPLGKLFYENGNVTKFWDNIESEIVSKCEKKATKLK